MSLHLISKKNEFLSQVNNFLERWNSNDLFIEVQTSGSTGTPKIIRLSKQHMKASARATGLYFGFKKGDRALLCLSVEHIAGIMMLVRALEFDLELTIVEPSSSPLQTINGSFDFCAMVPLQVEGTLSRNKEDLKRIGTLLIGGAPLSLSLESKLIEHGNKIYHSFGMTETISHVALRAIHLREQSYEALPGVTFSTVDQKLCIHAPMIGIETLVSNDLVELIDPTHFIWLGRSDLVINSGALKIHPEQIEAKLSPFISQPFFCAGIPHELLGMAHILCIESDPFPIQEAWFKDFKKHLIPKIIYFFKKFDYTTSGKVDRLETLKRLTDASKQVL